MTEKVSNWQRRWRQSLGRRRVLGGAALGGAGLTAWAVVGCARKEKPEAEPAAVQPKRGGTLHYSAFSSAPYVRGLDPHSQQASNVGRALLFYQTLVRANPRTWQVDPELAQTWEQPSPTEIVFTLAPGVKWHNKPPANGRELTADDVVFSLERIRTPEPRFLSRSLLDSAEKIQAVERSRVKLTLKLADATLLINLTGQTMVILAPEVVERAGSRFTEADTAVGTGPFVLTEKTDVSATHVRNPEYWKPGLPYLDQVLTPALEDYRVRWSAFLAGRLDIALPVPGIVARKYSGERGRFTLDEKFPAEWSATPGATRLFVNVRRQPFGDLRVYRALRLLVDHDAMLKNVVELEDGRGSYSQIFPPALAQWDFSDEEYVTRFLEWKRPKDEAVKAALDLLTAAGFTRENPLKLTITSQTSARWRVGSELLQSEWRRLSREVVQPDIRLFDSPTVEQVTTRRDYEVLHRGILVPSVEPDAYLRSISHSNGSFNWTQWSDSKVDALIDRQRVTLDVEQRKSLIKELLLYLIDHEPAVVLAGQYNLMAAYPKVKGWAPEGDFSSLAYQYENVWLDT